MSHYVARWQSHYALAVCRARAEQVAVNEQLGLAGDKIAAIAYSSSCGATAEVIPGFPGGGISNGAEVNGVVFSSAGRADDLTLARVSLSSLP